MDTNAVDDGYRSREAVDAVSEDPAGAEARAGAAGLPHGRSGTRQLEEAPSTVAYALFAGHPGPRPGNASPAVQANDAFADVPARFGFPAAPVIAGIDTGGALFDTTDATVGDGTIHYSLQLGGRRTPYHLRHEGAGTYTTSGVELVVDWATDQRFPQLDAFLGVGTAYRVAVRDVVQLDGPGGHYDWSVSRADVADAASGRPALSVLYAVWDVDEDEHGASAAVRGSPGVPMSHPAGPVAPTFPDRRRRTVGGATIDETARALVARGPRPSGP